MKIVAAVITIVITAATAHAGDAFVFPSVGFVHYDAADVDTYYNYLAAVPAFNYADGGRFTRAPLPCDDPSASTASAEAAARATALVVIGGPGEGDVATARAAFGVSAANVARVDGDVFAVAAALAASWARAADVVVVPYVADADAASRAGAACAAALASTLNAPLLYTYPKRTPYETLAALRRLGARNIYLVEVGVSCDDGAEGQLAEDGRYVSRAFGDAAAVTSFISSRLRRDRRCACADGA